MRPPLRAGRPRVKRRPRCGSSSAWIVWVCFFMGTSGGPVSRLQNLLLVIRFGLDVSPWSVCPAAAVPSFRFASPANRALRSPPCLLYTSDAADDLLCVDLGGRRLIK